MREITACLILALLGCAAPARGDEGARSRQLQRGVRHATLDLVPRRLSQRRGLLVETLHLDISPRPACVAVWARVMRDVLDVAEKLGCMVTGISDDLGEVGQLLAVAITTPVRITTFVLNTAGHLGTMRLTIAPTGGATSPTSLSLIPTFVQSGGGFSVLGQF